MNKPYQVSSFFDPMIAKLITHGKSREEARFHMIDALQNYGIHGIENNISYLHAIVHNDNFIKNTISTRFCAEHTGVLLATIENDRKSVPELLPLAAAIVSKPLAANSNRQLYPETGNIWNKIGYWRVMMQPELEMEGKVFRCLVNDLKSNQISADFQGEKVEIRFEEKESTQQIEVQLNGEAYTVFVSHPEPGKVFVNYNTHIFEVIRKDILPAQTDFAMASAFVGENGSNITSPMPGKVIKVVVKQGDAVAKGDLLLVVEAMKMENNILSPANAIVDRITVNAGDLVDSISTLIHLSSPEQKQSAV
jgi:acetyl/propionyl-CoA carboxylase alpha subunit